MRRDAHTPGAQGPHPLAISLAAALPHGSRVLVLGAGNGRSLPPLASAGFQVEVAPAEEQSFERFSGPYDGVLSTHALLHGTRETIGVRVSRLVERLRACGRFHATFGSTLDPRCGIGTWIAGDAWMLEDGPEAGVPHAFFHRAALEALLRPFREGVMEEREVSEIVGRWAHRGDDGVPPAFHWFVEASR